MKAAKFIVLALAGLNLAVFVSVFLNPRESDGIRVVVPLRPKQVQAPLVGRAAIFRLYGEQGQDPEPPVVNQAPKPPSPAAAPSAKPDPGPYLLLGHMTTSRGEAEYFVKDRRTGRVYTATAAESQFRFLRKTEKGIIIEVDGALYDLSR